ncbi:MAG: B12-binding domain-containing radical SAM protein [Deltaproteobacteria bacterium]|nr:B12-binding domain-containing radical SAM protein [Deltaproteobacteria bacterium]
MRVLFLTSLQDALPPPFKPLRLNGHIQLGLSYISALLRQHGHQTDLMVLTRDTPRAAIEREIARFRPTVVGFSSMTSEFTFMRETAAHLKRRFPELFLIVGGIHVTLNPHEDYLTDFNALCVGEGEYPMLELVQCLERGEAPVGIDNLWVRWNGTLHKNPPRSFVQNLDALPFPDRSLWTRWIRRADETPHTVMLCRGCPFECTYCFHHKMRDTAPGTYVRHRSPANILAEVEPLAEQSSANAFFFEGETFNVRMPWVLELCEALTEFNARRKHPCSFGVNVRPMRNDQAETLFAAMARAGFRYVNLGVESGSERVRREVLHRYYTNDDVIYWVQTARKHKLKVAFLNLIGVPGETYEDFRQTIKLNRACQPDWQYHNIFEPFPGVDLHEVCKTQNLLPEVPDDEMIRAKAILDLPGFSTKEIQRAFDWFNYDVYKGYRPRSLLLLTVAAAKCKSNYKLNRAFRIARELPMSIWIRRAWDEFQRY